MRRIEIPAASTLALLLLASPSHAQTITAPTSVSLDAKTSVANAPITKPRPTTQDESIRPFRIKVPQAQLTDLKRRIKETRWPDKETVADESQGVPLATLQELARYWATDYDWR